MSHHRRADPSQGIDLLVGQQVDEVLADGAYVQGRRYAGLGFTAFNFIPAGEDPAAQVQRLAAEILPALRT
jgi:hypothetical protein